MFLFISVVKMSGGMLLPPPSAKKQSGTTQPVQPAAKPSPVSADPFSSSDRKLVPKLTDNFVPFGG